MAEPDHLIVKPIPNLSKQGLAAAFPFFYIEPTKYESVLRKFFPVDKGPIIDVDPIGNSPVIIEKVFVFLATYRDFPFKEVITFLFTRYFDIVSRHL